MVYFMYYWGMNIAKHRKNAGLNQKDMAKRLGYSRRDTISRWECDTDSISLGNLRAYATACGVSLAVLLGLHENTDALRESVKKVLAGWAYEGH